MALTVGCYFVGETHRLAEKCSAAKPDSAEALLELATQSRLVGRFSEAAHLFKTVTKIDGTSTAALTGLTAVQLAQSGITDQVSLAERSGFRIIIHMYRRK